MRIGIDIRSLSANKHTGVEEYIYNLLPNLFRLGKRDQFILLYNSWKFPVPEEASEWEKYPNVTVTKYRWPSKFLNASTWFAKRPRLDRLAGDVDVMFLPNITFFSVSKSTPYVVTFHDLSFELFPNFFNLYRRLWHFSINPREKAEKAARIIAVSNSTAEDLKCLYKIAGKKICPIYLGLSSNFLDSSRNTACRIPLAEYRKQSRTDGGLADEWRVRKHYKLTEKPFMLYLGTIEPRKNLISLVKAYGEFRKKSNFNHDLVIAGAKGWSYKKIFCAAQASPFRKDIYFPGSIESGDRPILYKMSDLFVFPSFFEGFGLPPLEALASGTPVICSGSTSLLEIFGSHSLLINPHDPSEIAWAMERVLADQTLRESLISQGKKYAKEFDWEKTATKTLEVLHAASRKV